MRKILQLIDVIFCLLIYELLLFSCIKKVLKSSNTIRYNSHANCFPSFKSCSILTVADNIMLYCRYAVLDFGTNYCNMRNLIDGAG